MQQFAIHQVLLGKLDILRMELVELAFVLERLGSREAADVAMTTAARVGELCDEQDDADRSAGG